MNQTACDQVLKVFDYFVEGSLDENPSTRQKATYAYSELSKILTAEERMWLNITCSAAKAGKHLEEYKKVAAVTRKSLAERLPTIT